MTQSDKEWLSEVLDEGPDIFVNGVKMTGFDAAIDAALVLSESKVASLGNSSQESDRFDLLCKAVGLNTSVPVYYRREFVEAVRLFAARAGDEYMENEAIQVIGALGKEDMAEQDAAAELEQGIIDSYEPAAMEAGWEALQADNTSDCKRT